MMKVCPHCTEEIPVAARVCKHCGTAIVSKRRALGTLGLSLFAGGGCLMWTVVLIPIAIPMAIVGLMMALASLFMKTEFPPSPGK